MSKKKTNKAHNPAAKKARRPKSKNPFPFQMFRKQQQPQAPAHKHKKKHNPANFLSEPVSMAKTGVLALGGLVATRQLPQLVLGAKNTGWTGYFSNVIAALVTAFAASKTLGKAAGQAVLIGGSMCVIDRMFTDKFSSAASFLSLSGLGDARATTLGTIRNNAYYPVPVRYDKTGKPIIPQALINGVQAALPAPGPTASSSVAQLAGVGRLAGRF